MMIVIALLLGGFVLGIMPDPAELIDNRRRYRMADHSGYSTQELRSITASVLRRDRRRPRYGINA